MTGGEVVIKKGSKRAWLKMLGYLYSDSILLDLDIVVILEGKERERERERDRER